MNSFYIFLDNSFTGASAPSLPALSTALYEGTKDIHAHVENHSFMKNLLKGTLERRSYHQYLVDLTLIYTVLEEEIQLNLKICPELKKINYPALNRQQALEEDLNSDSFKHFPRRTSAAALRYAEHLRQLGRSYPLLLVAHAYVRYLGDLSGGMILKRYIEKKWPDAVHLYDFSELFKASGRPNTHAFKELYKEKLNSLAINKQVQNQLVQEAYVAFEYAEMMFNAIPLSKAKL